jgi:hypothetical protein
MIFNVASLLGGGIAGQPVSKLNVTLFPTNENTVQLTQSTTPYSPREFQNPIGFGEQLVISAFTAFGAVLVFVLGQIITKFIIDPIHEQKKVIGEIADALIYYSNEYSSPLFLGKMDKKGQEASDRFRRLATQLMSKSHLIPWYGFWSRIGFVRPIQTVADARSALIGLSNSAGSTEDTFDRQIVMNFEQEIRSALMIYDPRGNISSYRA